MNKLSLLNFVPAEFLKQVILRNGELLRKLGNRLFIFLFVFDLVPSEVGQSNWPEDYDQGPTDTGRQNLIDDLI